jgi:hypothetical protein
MTLKSSGHHSGDTVHGIDALSHLERTSFMNADKIVNTDKIQNQLLASLHITVLRLHQYFEAMATLQTELMASNKGASCIPPSPEQLELLLTQYLARRFNSTMRKHSNLNVEPSQPADLIPLLARIFTSFHEHNVTWEMFSKLADNNDFD